MQSYSSKLYKKRKRSGENLDNNSKSLANTLLASFSVSHFDMRTVVLVFQNTHTHTQNQHNKTTTR